MSSGLQGLVALSCCYMLFFGDLYLPSVVAGVLLSCAKVLSNCHWLNFMSTVSRDWRHKTVSADALGTRGTTRAFLIV